MQYDAPRFDPDSIVSSVLSGNEDAYRLIVSEYGLLVRGFLAARVLLSFCLTTIGENMATGPR